MPRKSKYIPEPLEVIAQELDENGRVIKLGKGFSIPEAYHNMKPVDPRLPAIYVKHEPGEPVDIDAVLAQVKKEQEERRRQREAAKCVKTVSKSEKLTKNFRLKNHS